MDRAANPLARSLTPSAQAQAQARSRSLAGSQVAVVGGGWAGLAAAVRATQRGAQVTLFEMARHLGGRARSVGPPDALRDNGQHILIGAYTATLALMTTVGADATRLLWRGPLSLRYPDGQGLALPAGPALPAFLRGVLAAKGWSWPHRLALIQAASGWMLRGFRCPADWSVARLCAGLPTELQTGLVEPLCVAALNTPMASASAQVFLTVLRDALFAAPGSADLLLPRAPLSDLLPGPGATWLRQHGGRLRLGTRVHQLAPSGTGWQVDGEDVDAVVLACSASEAARLVRPVAPDWAALAADLRYEPIVTGWLHDPRLRLPHPMVALRSGARSPAQFAFDLNALGVPGGGFSLVASGAAAWVAQGLPATGQAMLDQARSAFPGAFQAGDALRHIAAERRATFACTPGLVRPPGHIAHQLWAAGDHVAGPYPATLEGAVRSGTQAADGLLAVDRHAAHGFAMQK